MREPFTQLYLHLVWATWDRLPLITEDIKGSIYKCIHADCLKLGAEPLGIGGTDDHTHLLTRFPTTMSVAQLVKQVKGDSSHLAGKLLRMGDSFKWQGGYGAFTVSKSLVPCVRSYVLNQERHHRDGTTDRDLEITWDEVVPAPEF